MMLSGFGSMAQHRPRRRRRAWLLLSILTTVTVTALAGIALLDWSSTESLDSIQNEVSEFAAAMRVIRPLGLLLLLVALPYALRWTARKGWISSDLRDQVIGNWARIAICLALIEITIGQGALFVGGALTILYLIFLRIGKPTTSLPPGDNPRSTGKGDVQ